jgi:quinol monooxygenase YgiN
MNNAITLENFSTTNRIRHIGNSLYRISREHEDHGKWYIHETYNDKHTWAVNNAYHNNSLQFVIDKISSFTKEKEVVSLRFGNI